jgi:hypothetical protein
MTHQPQKARPIGPRTLQRLVEYTRRKRMLDDAERRGIVTIPAIIVQVRAQTELNRRDRAERTRGGPGTARAWNPERRLGAYRLQNGLAPLTVAQARNLRRRATRSELLELMGHDLVTPAELYGPVRQSWAAA